MAPEQPQVHDFTSTLRRLPVRIEATPVYDALLALWANSDCCDGFESYELGVDWFEDIRTKMSKGLAERYDDLGSTGIAWITALSLVHEAPEPKDVASFAAWLRDLPEGEFRRQLLGHKAPDEPELAAAAVAGDAAALDSLLDRYVHDDEWKHEIRTLMTRNGLATLLADLLEDFWTNVFEDHGKGFDRAAHRDARAKQALTLSMPAEQLIELATNGLAVQLPPGITEVVLAPSVVLTPWSLVLEHGSTRIFCYPVADEHRDADPDAPPAWLVKTYKALGDERRLKILRRLAEGEASLGDLAERVGLAKSTVHHHVGLLRAAGLVRVNMKDRKEHSTYTLRTEIVPEAARLMGMYLAGSSETTPEENNEE